MPRGTGVATYGRQLGETIVEMGWSLDGIFGLEMPSGAAEALKEVLFYGGLDRALTEAAPKLNLRRQIRRAFVSPLRRDLVEAPLSGVVSARGFRDRLPPFDRIFSYGGLFDSCMRFYRRFGRFMPVRMTDPPDLVHWTYPLPIRLQGARNIYTIHDLVPLRLPQTSTEDKAYHYRLIAAILSQADHVATVSNTSRRDILEIFPTTDPSRVTNTYQAAPLDAAQAALSEAEAARRLRRLFDLAAGEYFLYFGALEPKKNIGRAIEAYLTEDIASPFVIVGARSWKSDQELRLLNGDQGAALPGAARIRRMDYLPRDMLSLLIRGARAVVFPSLYEGFGLPVLEAMALGAPVLVSHIEALAEVVGEAGLRVDPYDIASIGAGLRRLEEDEGLRRHLSSAGREQAEKFSTAIYTERLRALYEGVLSRSPVQADGGL